MNSVLPATLARGEHGEAAGLMVVGDSPAIRFLAGRDDRSVFALNPPLLTANGLRTERGKGASAAMDDLPYQHGRCLHAASARAVATLSNTL